MKHDAHIENGAEVLVVDDDELTRYVVARRLREWGCDPVVFEVPRDALHYLRRSSSNALVTDMYMPETTGLALARAVRLVRPHMPIVLMTGNPDPLLCRNARDNGIFEVVVKKVGSHEDLRRALRRALIRSVDGVQGPGSPRADVELAHALHTPLMILKDAIGNLCGAELPVPQQRFADRAQRNLEEMTVLVERLLHRTSVKH